MTPSSFSHQIDVLQQRVDVLLGLAVEHPSRSEEVLPESLQELLTTLEELRVAEEELRQQNEQLVAAREALEGQRQRYQDLFEFAPDAYLVTDRDGTIREANQAAAQLLGAEAKFLMQKPLVLYFADDQRPVFHHQLARLPQLGRVQDWEVRLKSRHGPPFDAAVTVAPVRDREGAVAGFRWLLRDISDRRRARQAERLAAIGQMMAGLVHESRNALQRSQACLEMLALDVKDRPDTLNLVARIRKAQDDLYTLYEEVRSYAAPLVLKRQPCHLGEVLQEAWDHLDFMTRGRDVRLRQDAGAADLHGQVDRLHLERVFGNILENSLGACRDPVQIDVRWSEDEIAGRPALGVAVRDNGPGLTPEQRCRIFEPFFTTKAQGTGLGMAIAQRVVEAHGGTIAVGECPAPGTEIVITLPKGEEDEPVIAHRRRG